MSSSSREAILSRIADHANCDAEYEAIPRSYDHAGSLTKHKRLELFIDRLKEYGAGVFRCALSEIAATIAERCGNKNIAIAIDLPGAWLSPRVSFVLDHALTYRELESAGGVLTGCAIAIADTGTIVLDGHRLLTLLPDYHLCVVFEEQVVETVPEAMLALSPAMSRPLTFISGPSATADIEMTRIQGVHGPRSMEVILVG